MSHQQLTLFILLHYVLSCNMHVQMYQACITLKSDWSDAFSVSERETFLACQEIHLHDKATQLFLNAEIKSGSHQEPI